MTTPCTLENNENKKDATEEVKENKKPEPTKKIGKKEEGKIAKKAEEIVKKVKNNMYPERNSPQFVHEIYSRKKSVNDLLKRAISNANRHGINLRPGQLNNSDGNCLWEALIYNILYRQCIKSKNKENHRQLRKRSLDKAQIDAQNKKVPLTLTLDTRAYQISARVPELIPTGRTTARYL